MINPNIAAIAVDRSHDFQGNSIKRTELNPITKIAMAKEWDSGQ
jgi:hypothetical protein